MSTTSPRSKGAGLAVAAFLAALVLVAGTFLYLWVFEQGPFHPFNRPRSASMPIDVGLYRLKISYVSVLEQPEVQFRYHSLPGGESPADREFVESAPPPVPFVVGDDSRRRLEPTTMGMPGGGNSNTVGDLWKKRIEEAGVPVIWHDGGKRGDRTGDLRMEVRVLEETKEKVTFRVHWEAWGQFRDTAAGTKTPFSAEGTLDSWSTDWYTIRRKDRAEAIEYATRLCVSNFVREYHRQNRQVIP